MKLGIGVFLGLAMAVYAAPVELHVRDLGGRLSLTADVGPEFASATALKLARVEIAPALKAWVDEAGAIYYVNPGKLQIGLPYKSPEKTAEGRVTFTIIDKNGNPAEFFAFISLKPPNQGFSTAAPVPANRTLKIQQGMKTLQFSIAQLGKEFAATSAPQRIGGQDINGNLGGLVDLNKGIYKIANDGLSISVPYHPASATGPFDLNVSFEIPNRKKQKIEFFAKAKIDPRSGTPAIDSAMDDIAGPRNQSAGIALDFSQTESQLVFSADKIPSLDSPDGAASIKEINLPEDAVGHHPIYEFRDQRVKIMLAYFPDVLTEDRRFHVVFTIPDRNKKILTFVGEGELKAEALEIKCVQRNSALACVVDTGKKGIEEIGTVRPDGADPAAMNTIANYRLDKDGTLTIQMDLLPITEKWQGKVGFHLNGKINRAVVADVTLTPPLMLWLLISGGVLLVGLVIVGAKAVQVFRRRHENAAAPTRESAAGVTIHPRIDETTAAPAQTALPPALPVQSNRIAAELRAMAMNSDNNLRQDLTGLENRVRIWGTNTDVDRLLRVISPSSSARAQSSIRTAGPPDVLLASCVNKWLALGANDRGTLTRLATDVGLSVGWYAHVDRAKPLADTSRFAYRFEPSSDQSGWIWAVIDGSRDQLAIPAAIAFFQIGRAPDLLERLFEGMQEYPPGFRFEKFYRACRLRPVDGEEGVYECAERGVLRLVGGKPANVSEPPNYDSLPCRASGWQAQAQPPVTFTVAALLAERFKRADEELRQATSDVGYLRQEMEELRRAKLRPEGAKGSQNVDNIKRDMESVRRDSRSNFDELRKSIDDLKRSLTANTEDSKGGLESMANRVRKLERSQMTLEHRVVKMALLAEVPAAKDASRLPPPQPPDVAQSALEAPPESAPRTLAAAASNSQASTQAATEVYKAPSLPEGWWQDINGIQPAQSPEESDAQFFMRRLNRGAWILADAAGPNFDVGIVQLNKQTGETFDIQPVAETGDGASGGDGQIFASDSVFQRAIHVGRLGERELLVFLPPGQIIPQKFPGGYRLLIGDHCSTPYRIGEIIAPARLSAPRPGAPYAVTEKLKWKE